MESSVARWELTAGGTLAKGKQLGRRAQGSGLRVQGSGFRVQGSGYRVQGSEFRVQGSGFRVQGLGFRVQGSGFRAHLAADVPDLEVSVQRPRGKELTEGMKVHADAVGAVASEGAHHLWGVIRASRTRNLEVGFDIWCRGI